MDAELLGLLTASVLVLVGLVVFAGVWAGTDLVCSQCTCDGSAEGGEEESASAVPDTNVPIDDAVTKEATVGVALTGAVTRAVITYETGFSSTDYVLQTQLGDATEFRSSTLELSNDTRYPTGFTTELTFADFPFAAPTSTAVGVVPQYRLPRVVRFQDRVYVFAVGAENDAVFTSRVYMAQSTDASGTSFNAFAEIIDNVQTITSLDVVVFGSLLIVGTTGDAVGAGVVTAPKLYASSTATAPFLALAVPNAHFNTKGLSSGSLGVANGFVVFVCVQSEIRSSVLRFLRSSDGVSWAPTVETSTDSFSWLSASSVSPSVVPRPGGGFWAFFVNLYQDLSVLIYDAANDEYDVARLPHQVEGLHALSAADIDGDTYVATMGTNTLHVAKVTDRTLVSPLEKRLVQKFTTGARVRGVKLVAVQGQPAVLGMLGAVSSNPMADLPSNFVLYQFQGPTLASDVTDTVTAVQGQDVHYVDGPDFDQFIMDAEVTADGSGIDVVSYLNSTGLSGQISYHRVPAGVTVTYNASPG